MSETKQDLSDQIKDLEIENKMLRGLLKLKGKRNSDLSEVYICESCSDDIDLTACADCGIDKEEYLEDIPIGEKEDCVLGANLSPSGLAFLQSYATIIDALRISSERKINERK